MRTSPQVSIDQADILALHRLVRGRNTAQKVVLRARIVLLSSEAMPQNQIAKELETSRVTVGLWRDRFQQGGLDALLRDAPRPGRKPKLQADKEQEIVEATLRTEPQGATHWSVRSMAETQGVSRMMVHRVWKKYQLQPHRTKPFKVSTDPAFVEKVRDIVGLYMNPPDKALVLSVDEKSQIQALDRTQPGLPMKQGQAGTMTHDYKRHGTTTLFAALNLLDGKVIGSCMKKHRAEEFLVFLRLINRQTPRHLALHIIVDNYGTHKTEKVKLWLSKHPRFHMHYTPTSASWINMVERFFSALTVKRIRRGVFRSVESLEQAIMGFIDAHNKNPKVFVWTKDADTIIGKVLKCKEALGTAH
jgi:transposase